MLRPLIGINMDHAHRPSGAKRLAADWAYAKAVEDAGGAPLLLPWMGPKALDRALDALDGILLIGGDDLDSALLGQLPHPKVTRMDPDRQAFDLLLVSKVLERRLPVLGICFGCQLLNVARGGSLVQHLDGHQAVRHRVALEPSRVSRILGGNRVETNSFHHQAVSASGQGLEIVGRAPDGTVEALEDPGHPFLVGVQWHPEKSYSDRPGEARLFRALVRAALRRKSHSTKGMKRPVREVRARR